MIDKDFEMATQQREFWWPVGGRMKQITEGEFIAAFRNAELEQDPIYKMMVSVGSIPDSQKVSHKTIRYGQLIQAAMPGGGFSPACKVHFFNTRGVLIGNLYEFVDYTRLRLHHKGLVWERIAYGKKYEGLRQWTYETLCRVITYLLKITQKLSR